MQGHITYQLKNEWQKCEVFGNPGGNSFCDDWMFVLDMRWFLVKMHEVSWFNWLLLHLQLTPQPPIYRWSPLPPLQTEKTPGRRPQDRKARQSAAPPKSASVSLTLWFSLTPSPHVSEQSPICHCAHWQSTEGYFKLILIILFKEILKYWKARAETNILYPDILEHYSFHQQK